MDGKEETLPGVVLGADDTFLELCQSLSKTKREQVRELKRLWNINEPAREK